MSSAPRTAGPGALALAGWLVCTVAWPGQQVVAQGQPQREDSVTIRIQNTELRAAVQMLGQYLDRPVVMSGQGTGQVTLETPRPVPRADVVRLLRGLLESQNFELVDDSASGLFRARPKEAVRSAPPPVQSNASGLRPAAEQELFMIALKHVRAVDIASTLSALYGRGSYAGDYAARPQTLGQELRANLVPPAGLAAPGTAPATASRVALSGEITIVPDSRANSLLVRCNRADYELISRIVEQLDVRPLQVLIEVLIAEVRRNHSLGINVSGTLGETVIGGGPAKATGSLGAPGLGDFALKVMGIGGKDLDATLSLAAERGDVRILSRPVVLTANNEQATIVVGSQRPFVQLQRALPTDAAVRDQVVQYKDVGTKLTVRPSISIDGSVQLEVTQEVSSATSETAFNAPVISTRSVQTQLLIRDGQTVALGGLTDRQKDVTQGGLPILSSIPLIGGIFGHSQRQSTETELFVFLTPRVIRTDDDAMRLTAPMKAQAEKIRP